MNHQSSAEVATLILAITASLRSKLQRFQGRFNDPALLARLSRQSTTLATKCLNLCEQVDTEEAYNALVAMSFLVSDFELACENMNADVANKLHLLRLKLHSEVHHNRRRISAGHPKKVPA